MLFRDAQVPSTRRSPCTSLRGQEALTGATGPGGPIRLAHSDQNDGARRLRRGYSFTDGEDDLGRLDAGPFFMAFVRDPARSVDGEADHREAGLAVVGQRGLDPRGDQTVELQ